MNLLQMDENTWFTLLECMEQCAKSKQMEIGTEGLRACDALVCHVLVDKNSIA